VIENFDYSESNDQLYGRTLPIIEHHKAQLQRKRMYKGPNMDHSREHEGLSEIHVLK